MNGTLAIIVQSASAAVHAQTWAEEGNALLVFNLSEETTQASTEKMQAGVSFANFYPSETQSAKELMKEGGDKAMEKLCF